MKKHREPILQERETVDVGLQADDEGAAELRREAVEHKLPEAPPSGRPREVRADHQPDPQFEDALDLWGRVYEDRSGYMTLVVALESFWHLTMRMEVQDASSPGGIGYRAMTDDERAKYGLS